MEGKKQKETYLSIKSAEPTKTDPYGPPNPLFREKQTESIPSVSSATGKFSFTAALKILAPSMCTGIFTNFAYFDNYKQSSFIENKNKIEMKLKCNGLCENRRQKKNLNGNTFSFFF